MCPVDGHTRESGREADVRISASVPRVSEPSAQEFWDAEAETFDDDPDHGLRDPRTRAAWLDLLAGRLLLVEGRWHTGAGLSADETSALVRAVGREPVTHHLADPTLWGRAITDERYLVVG